MKDSLLNSAPRL